MKLLLAFIPSILGCWNLFKTVKETVEEDTTPSDGSSETLEKSPTDLSSTKCQSQEDCGNGWMCKFNSVGKEGTCMSCDKFESKWDCRKCWWCQMRNEKSTRQCNRFCAVQSNPKCPECNEISFCKRSKTSINDTAGKSTYTCECKAGYTSGCGELTTTIAETTTPYPTTSTTAAPTTDDKTTEPSTSTEAPTTTTTA